MASSSQDLYVDNKSEHIKPCSQSLDLDDVGHDLEDLGPFNFVVMHKFQILITHTAALEEQLRNVNANLMQVMNLL